MATELACVSEFIRVDSTAEGLSHRQFKPSAERPLVTCPSTLSPCSDTVGRIIDCGGEGINLAHPSFAVTFNSTTDQSAAVQCWINALKDSTTGLTSLGILPSDRWVTISNTINISAFDGLRIAGPGSGGFQFRWAGNSTDPMFRLTNTQNVAIEGFTVLSSSAAKLAIAFEVQGGTGTPFPAYNIFRDIVIQGTNANGLDRGFFFRLASTDDAGNNHNTLEHITVYNYSQAAVEIYGYNAHSIQLLWPQFEAAPAGGSFTGGKYGVYCDRGFFNVRGGFFGSNSEADFYVQTPNGAIHVSDLNVEGSKRLLQTYGLLGAPQPITIQGVRWAADGLHSDAKAIIQYNPGPLTLIGNRMGDGGGTVTPRVEVNALGTYGFVSHGNQWGGQSGLTTSPYILSTSSLGPLPVRIHIDGDIFVYAPLSGSAQYNPRALAVNSATPAVHTGHVFYAENTAATTITNLTQGYVTQRVTIVAGNGNTTFQNNGTTIKLKTAGNRTLAANDTIELLNADGTLWVEV